ncbi:TIGR03757 family integrating conjugative element protein [Pseudomonas lopnurensis]|uniref:TIGR03757 family integrating conjugative element protein n=1 Tax=Pseudomonas lopnurensis TaxID=1477517 RepID=UPI0028A7CBE0|nr:TIGR03757 family integrating conjugative element protein [Pseudomonas lopnurensis]
MRYRPALYLFAVLAASATVQTVAHAAAAEIIVYSTSQIQLTNVPPGAQIIELDRLQQLEARISHGLPANPQQAAHLIQQRMNNPEWRSIEGQVRKAAEDIAGAKSAGIRKVPAVTVDGSYVVYGASDVAAAVQQIQHARQQR